MEHQPPHPKEKHTHSFEPIEVHVPLHEYNNQRTRKGSMTGKDILKQRQCKCGLVETYDLKRVQA